MQNTVRWKYWFHDSVGHRRNCLGCLELYSDETTTTLKSAVVIANAIHAVLSACVFRDGSVYRQKSHPGGHLPVTLALDLTITSSKNLHEQMIIDYSSTSFQLNFPWTWTTLCIIHHSYRFLLAVIIKINGVASRWFNRTTLVSQRINFLLTGSTV